MKTLKIVFLVSVSLILVLSCNSDSLKPSAPAPFVPVGVLKSASDTVSIGSVSYSANMSPWRDFMPGPDKSSNGSDLIVIANLCRTDSLPVSENVHLKYLWIVYDDLAWGSVLGEERGENFCRGAIARGGPKWGPFVEVWGVIGFTESGDELQLIRVPVTVIGRTD